MKKESVFQMIKFALFSASAGIIQALSFTIFNEIFNWIYWPAYLTALILSIVWNFTLNHNQHHPNPPTSLKKRLLSRCQFRYTLVLSKPFAL